MPDYQRVKVVAMPTLYGYDTWWEVQCEACKTPQTASASWAGELRYARKHWATCPALRLQRLLADLEAETHRYWPSGFPAPTLHANRMLALVDKYREAPDA